MAEILLMRHAKSDRAGWSADDRSRPLNSRGVRSAQAMGRFITESGAIPDRVLTSPAERARTTAELAREAGEWAVPLVEVEALYGGGVRQVIYALSEVRESLGRVMVVGHEPTWSHTVAALIGGGFITMVTAAVACVEFSGSRWDLLGPGQGNLRWMMIPRLLEA